ncbi:Phasin protein [Bradyrhizobium sp. CB3481]|uniref:Phasin protein n=1 Tax=Bradyrhizobium sp. CB3481 TaxID=3039158 RepID=UPI0024B25758|nr:Phasin protein [Bradyrhizobium sp. CB3481]WFU18728.1 Phasin protein [Bradyrhizobium sp. CB3481]
MSKRKPGKASKRARSPAIAARAHGKRQAVVRSAKDNLLRPVAAGPIEFHDDAKKEAPNVEKQEAPEVEKPEAPITANPVQAAPCQERGFDPVSATGTIVAYQVKLVQLTQANLRFAFDFSQKLATIRSPFQFADVVVEFTKRRADMLGEQATEMAELTKR